ncbi:helix-turn-helix transcriptional regulator [Chloroflexota bacterium]
MTTLKKLRLKKLLSQEKLAKLSGVSRTTIVAIENRQHLPQPLTIQKLANALEVDPTEIDDHDRVK